MKQFWIETSDEGQGKLPELVYDEEPNMSGSRNKQMSVHVIEAQPVFDLLDEVEKILSGTEHLVTKGSKQLRINEALIKIKEARK